MDKIYETLKDIEFAEPWYLRGLFEYRMQER
jgi:hypothetical protein